ncbi:hypothetical protein BCU83_02995 [Vibrio breoganii]|nr:hypothetical protein BCU83_02995 [Vibrio breoganii]
MDYVELIGFSLAPTPGKASSIELATYRRLGLIGTTAVVQGIAKLDIGHVLRVDIDRRFVGI